MKKSIAISLMLLAFHTTIAQTKKIELFGLVKLLLPDSVAGPKDPSWISSAEINGAVKWKSAPAMNNMKAWTRQGQPNLLLNGKPLTCVDDISGKKSPCKWEVLLTGNKQGYHSFSLSTTDFPADSPEKAIELLFKNNKTSFPLYKKCIEGAVFWSAIYKVVIPGRKAAWLWITFESMAATAAQYEHNGISNAFTLSFYFNKQEAETQCQ